MKHAFLLPLLLLTPCRAQRNERPSATATLLHAWVPALTPLSHPAGGMDDSIAKAVQAIRHGRFRDAEMTLDNARRAAVSPRDRFLVWIASGMADSARYSLLGGGFGNQSQLSIARAAAAKAAPQQPAYSSVDATAAGMYQFAISHCIEEVHLAIRAVTDSRQQRLPCEAIRGPLDSAILSEAAKATLDRLVHGGFAAATDKPTNAEKLFLAGREAARRNGQRRAEAEFCLRLADIKLSPRGHWMSLGFGLASEGLVRAQLTAGATPPERRPVPAADLDAAERWLREANTVASDQDQKASVAHRRGALALERGDLASAIRAFQEAGDAARSAGWIRLAGLAWGLSATLSLNERLLDQALTIMQQQSDMGGIASLFELIDTRITHQQTRRQTEQAWETARVALRASAGKYGRSEQALLRAAGPLRRALDDLDGALYWLTQSAENQREFLRSATGKPQLDQEALVLERLHLGVLLQGLEAELIFRNATEESPHWAAQLAASEKESGALMNDPAFAAVRQQFANVKKMSLRSQELRIDLSRVGSCMDLKSQLRSLEQRASGGLDADELSLHLAVRCGDAERKKVLQSTLARAPIPDLLNKLTANARRLTLVEQATFNEANLALTGLIGKAVLVGSFDLAERWLAQADAQTGPSLFSAVQRLQIARGRKDASATLVQARALRAHPDWAKFGWRDRLTVLAAMVDAHADSGAARESLTALLDLWSEQSGSPQSIPIGAHALDALRRADLLRSPPAPGSAAAAELRRLSLENLRDPRVAPPALDALLRRIPSSTTVLVFHGDQQLRLWQLRGGAVRLIPLSEDRELSARMDRFRSALGNLQGTSEEATALHRLILGDTKFTAGETIAIAGAGALHGLPFAALRDGQGQPLGLQHPIVYIDDLLRRAPPRPTATRGGMVFGTSDAASQAAAVAEITGATYSGRDANRADLLRAKGAAWTHFATHGRIDAANPYRSSLLLAAGDRLWGWQLPQVLGPQSMIVFGACDTNLALSPIGEIPRPGFARGLALFAHASQTPWVVSTLWKVNAQATERIMKTYYRELLEHGSPAKALMQANRSVAAGNPGLWAGFVASVSTIDDLAVKVRR